MYSEELIRFLHKTLVPVSSVIYINYNKGIGISNNDTFMIF